MTNDITNNDRRNTAFLRAVGTPVLAIFGLVFGYIIRVHGVSETLYGQPPLVVFMWSLFLGVFGLLATMDILAVIYKDHADKTTFTILLTSLLVSAGVSAFATWAVNFISF